MTLPVATFTKDQLPYRTTEGQLVFVHRSASHKHYVETTNDGGEFAELVSEPGAPEVLEFNGVMIRAEDVQSGIPLTALLKNYLAAIERSFEAHQKYKAVLEKERELAMQIYYSPCHLRDKFFAYSNKLVMVDCLEERFQSYDYPRLKPVTFQDLDTLED